MSKKAEWVRVENVAEFMRGGRRVKRTHEFTRRVCHWPYCSGCGLLLLKNAATARAAKGPCWRIED